MDISALLERFHQTKASDIHLSTGNPPILRIHGDITPLPMPALSANDVLSFLHGVMTPKQQKEYEAHLELDFAVVLEKGGRFRVNAFHTLEGPAAALRGIPDAIRTLEEIKAPEALFNLASLQKGLILVTGPTGSGKSTTMSALINHINQHSAKHILTIEDPVEFIHKSAKSLINQREVGAQTSSFARALKSALREDPDVILVGELRDIETIQLAMTAAETGHLVIATLHTSSAAQTIDRIIDVFSSADKAMIRTMLSSSLEAVISQRLIKKRDNNGRVLALEILLANAPIRNLIREGKVPQIYSIMQVSSKLGMRVMKDSVEAFLEAGIITKEAAKEVLNSMEIGDTPVQSGTGGLGLGKKGF